jgi:hypothetical protein
VKYIEIRQLKRAGARESIAANVTSTGYADTDRAEFAALVFMVVLIIVMLYGLCEGRVF